MLPYPRQFVSLSLRGEFEEARALYQAEGDHRGARPPANAFAMLEGWHIAMLEQAFGVIGERVRAAGPGLGPSRGG